MNSRADEPHGIQYIAVLGDPQQFVRHGDRVHVTLFAVVEVSVGTPDSLEHFDAEAERLDRAQEAQARVTPRLPEVTVHRIILESIDSQRRDWTRDDRAKLHLYRAFKKRSGDTESGSEDRVAFQPRVMRLRAWNAIGTREAASTLALRNSTDAVDHYFNDPELIRSSIRSFFRIDLKENSLENRTSRVSDKSSSHS